MRDEECTLVSKKTNKAAQILALQSSHLKQLLELGYIEFDIWKWKESLLNCTTNKVLLKELKTFPIPASLLPLISILSRPSLC